MRHSQFLRISKAFPDSEIIKKGKLFIDSKENYKLIIQANGIVREFDDEKKLVSVIKKHNMFLKMNQKEKKNV